MDGRYTCQEIVVPAAVATEIEQYGETDVTAIALAQTDWLVVVESPNQHR